MINGKYVIIESRPIWRHYRLPWGWYSLTDDSLILFGRAASLGIMADGYLKPNDGGGGLFSFKRFQ